MVLFSMAVAAIIVSTANENGVIGGFSFVGMFLPLVKRARVCLWCHCCLLPGTIWRFY